MEILRVEECGDGARIIRFGTPEEVEQWRRMEEQEEEANRTEGPKQHVEDELPEEEVFEAMSADSMSEETSKGDTREAPTHGVQDQMPHDDMSGLKVTELRVLAKERGITVSAIRSFRHALPSSSRRVEPGLTFVPCPCSRDIPR